MIAFPQAKINLGLSVVSKREDGFHNLETVFYPVPLRDALEIVPAPAFSLTITGLPLPGNPEENLVMRAYALMKRDFPQIISFEIHLHKAIPSGAGLGGGSSDAAALLRLVNEYCGLSVSAEQLAAYALTLGSDCPFFLQSLPCFAQGRGEILEPVPVDLSSYSLLLVHPELSIPTAWAFSQIRPAPPGSAIRNLMGEPPSAWRGRLQNDFETPVFRQYPQLENIKNRLYEAGALYASLSGSGSSLYGIFEKNSLPPEGLPIAAKQHLL
jgi:4-diphosphocytidyl-2-C-methyl-D-erythritol kinase